MGAGEAGGAERLAWPSLVWWREARCGGGKGCVRERAGSRFSTQPVAAAQWGSDPKGRDFQTGVYAGCKWEVWGCRSGSGHPGAGSRGRASEHIKPGWQRGFAGSNGETRQRWRAPDDPRASVLSCRGPVRRLQRASCRALGAACERVPKTASFCAWTSGQLRLGHGLGRRRLLRSLHSFTAHAVRVLRGRATWCPESRSLRGLRRTLRGV